MCEGIFVATLCCTGCCFLKGSKLHGESVARDKKMVGAAVEGLKSIVAMNRSYGGKKNIPRDKLESL